MTTLEILLIGIGLSMDAVAVSMTNGMVYRNTSKGKIIAQPLYFSIFQGIMPLLGGALAGGIFADAISKYSGITVFLILGIIGGKMVKEGYSKLKEEVCTKPFLTHKILLLQAFATSIDAFAVGIGLELLHVDLIPAASIIAATTGVLVAAAMILGKKFGEYLGCKAEILGGVILILIGIKALL